MPNYILGFSKEASIDSPREQEESVKIVYQRTQPYKHEILLHVLVSPYFFFCYMKTRISVGGKKERKSSLARLVEHDIELGEKEGRS